ncbi:MAG: amino acid transporter [Burkholderiales bacterium]|jgi:L-lysine exporter family protein LysE/ArgO|nr:amino acid transporter [Burkholderiales bacterium]
MDTQLIAWLAGLSLGASLVVAVGAQNTFVLQQGLRREHVGAVVAVCLGLDAILMTLGVNGVAAALGSHPALLAAMGWAGVAFLLWYAWQAARRAVSGQALSTRAGGRAKPLGGVLLQTLACTLLNPHVYLDTLLLVGAVGAQQAPVLRPAFIAGCVSASAVWFVGLGFGARLLAPVFARPAAWRWLDGGVALTMGLLGLRLAAGVLRA